MAMASVADNSPGARLRRCGNTTAAKLTAQNTAADAISRDAQRIAASQRFLRVQSLARNLGLAMGLPFLLSAAAFLLLPAKASEWEAPSPGREGVLSPYGAGNWVDSRNYVYLPDEEAEAFSSTMGAKQRADKEGQSAVGEIFPLLADSERSSNEPQSASTDDPPQVRQKKAEASAVEEDAEATAPELDGAEASALGEEVAASEHNGPVSSDTLPAAAFGDDTFYLDENEDDRMPTASAAAFRSAAEENMDESAIVSPAAAPENETDEAVAEKLTELLARATDLLSTSKVPRAEATNSRDMHNGPTNAPAVDTLETEEEPEDEGEKATEVESGEPAEIGAAPELQSEEEDGLYEAATGPTWDDDSVNMPNETAVPSQKLSSATMIESNESREAAPAPESDPDEEDELYEAARRPTGDDESVSTHGGTSVPSQSLFSSLESERHLRVRDSHPQPANDYDTLAAAEELRDVPPLESGSIKELQVKSTPRGSASASRGQRMKSQKKNLRRRETQSHHRSEALGQQSRQTSGRSHRAEALYAEEEDAGRKLGKTESLRGTAKGASRTKHKEMMAGVRWQNVLRLAALLGLASAGAEAGLMYMNRSIAKRESPGSVGPETAGVTPKKGAPAAEVRRGHRS